MRRPASQYDPYEEPDDAFDLMGEERDGEAGRRDRRLPAIGLTLFVMALFAGSVWFAYVQGTKHSAAPAQAGASVPLIHADDRPAKVRPEQPGGMPMPDQNVSLYNDRPGRKSVERLLPPPEQPLPRPAPPPRQAAPPPAPAAPAPASPAETVAAPASPGADQTAAAKPADTGVPAAAKPAPVQKAAAAAPAGPPGPGKIQVRLGSLRSPEAAREEWHRLKRDNADLLGALSAYAVPVDLGEKGLYYRIVAGPFADAAAAERLCDELKRRNRGCILAR